MVSLSIRWRNRVWLASSREAERGPISFFQGRQGLSSEKAFDLLHKTLEGKLEPMCLEVLGNWTIVLLEGGGGGCTAQLWATAPGVSKLYYNLSWILLRIFFKKRVFLHFRTCKVLEEYSDKYIEKRTTRLFLPGYLPRLNLSFEHSINHRHWLQAFSVEDT